MGNKMRVIVPVVLAPLLVLIFVFQPHYFLANPSRYSLFSAFVADRGVVVERGISFADHPRLKLDVYSPDSDIDATSSPVVLFLYGGTWKEGDRAIYGFVGAALAARGITTVIPDYRLFPDARFPTFIHDAAEAYAWTRQRFPEPDRPIIVMGHSAGAHMAAMLAFNPSYTRSIVTDIRPPSALIGLAGPYVFDLTTYPTTKDLFPTDQDPSDTIPANFASAGAPPALLIHGEADETVKLANQQKLAEKLMALKVPVETHVPEGATHVGVIRALAWPFRNSSPVTDLVVKFAHDRRRPASN